MKRALVSLFLLLATALVATRPVSATEPTVDSCDRASSLRALTPPAPEPLRLRHVFCWPGPSGWLPYESPTLSPDGAAVTRWSKQTGFTVYRDGEPPLHLPIQRGAAGMEHDPSARWSENGAGFWAFLQPRADAGWRLGPMRAVFVTTAGETKALPPLKHRAGPLDSVLWIDGRGLALTQFGSRGDSYRPEHPDPAPIFAFVDERRGRVLDTLRYSDIGWNERSVLRQAAAVRVPNGRAKAVLVLHDHWAVWTQGRPPIVRTNPYVGEQGLVTLSPGGDRVIVRRPLPGLMVCIRTKGCSGPVTRGVALAMHDVDSGALLWTLEAEGVGAAWTARPAFSPDGRHILAATPQSSGGGEIVLIDAASGKVKQRLLTFPWGDQVLGFTAAGDPWVVTSQSVLLYAFVRPEGS